MFGGDVRKLDNSTYNLITRPTLLEINSFSSNNMEFTSAKVLDGRDQTFRRNQEGRRLQDIRTSSSHVLGLASCTDSKAVGWFLAGLEKICWKDNTKSSQPSLAFLPLQARFSCDILEEDKFYAWTNPGKIHSSASGGIASCLDASPKRKLSSEDFMRGSFLPCSQDAAQIWEFNLNGTLLNSHSGRCLTVNPSNAASDSSGIRSWIATGQQGEIYVAFFNLNSKTLTISAKISDVAKSLPATHLEQSACKYREVWSGEEVGEAKEWITMAVEAHGCALFVLNCD